jgi:hypothetical protein
MHCHLPSFAMMTGKINQPSGMNPFDAGSVFDYGNAANID